MHISAMLQAIQPKRFGLLGFVLIPLAAVCGCDSMNYTERGALAGGAVGGVAGGLIGSAAHAPVAGALIGAGAGALSGGLIGAAADDVDRKNQARVAAAAAQRGALGITDVIQMTQQHISDQVIISQIRTTGTVFQLSPNDIVWLKQNGVTDVVIQEMQSTAYRYPRRQVYNAVPVYGAPYYTPDGVYVVPAPPPPPPPPVGFGVGIGFRR